MRTKRGRGGTAAPAFSLLGEEGHRSIFPSQSGAYLLSGGYILVIN